MHFVKAIGVANCSYSVSFSGSSVALYPSLVCLLLLSQCFVYSS